MNRKHVHILFLAITALTILIPISIFIGFESINPSFVWEVIKNSETQQHPLIFQILIYHRLPRTLVSILVGMGLSLGGVAFQSLLRNPLATPYTLGTASFASLGAYLAYLGHASITSLLSISLKITFPVSHIFAFLFAVGEIVLILTLIKIKPKISATVLLLSGITLGMLANAFISILRYVATPDKLVFMERWWFGSTQVLGYRAVVILSIVSLPSFFFLWRFSEALDQYTFDIEIAQSRGINIVKLQTYIFLIVSIMTAVIVAEVGPIGFVGLIIPHITRYFVGSSHRRVIPYSALFGGIFLLLCDILSRKIFSTGVPVGIITTLIGVPAFLYILFGKDFKEWLT
ncbi:MAG TPA: iron ABC transporter permease [Candidatus Hydrogenedens sp.]|nr:iron ABC transporter permease [Candidatus Hydrogenedens sp.]HOL20564.1 iron ABC transporter permease [Candidatus Hydrogenedens sp.]HPP59932.1 iron ABC transporter permease [Candidatus Hydrogenedens sp.]